MSARRLLLLLLLAAGEDLERLTVVGVVVFAVVLTLICTFQKNRWWYDDVFYDDVFL